MRGQSCGTRTSAYETQSPEVLVNRVCICTRYILAAGILALSAPAIATAQRSETPRANTEKLMLSVSLDGTSLYSKDFQDERHSGGGASVQLGWGFSHLFTLLADASGSVLDRDEPGKFTLVHFDLLGRFNFASPRRAWVPFVEGGLSGRIAGQSNIVVIGDAGPQEVDLWVSGGGLTFGGGVQYYIVPALALGANVRWTVGEFSTVKFNNVSVDGFELDATTTRMNLGLTWRPMFGKR